MSTCRVVFVNKSLGWCLYFYPTFMGRLCRKRIIETLCVVSVKSSVNVKDLVLFLLVTVCRPYAEMIVFYKNWRNCRKHPVYNNLYLII